MTSQGGASLRVNGPRDRICNFKVVLLGKCACQLESIVVMYVHTLSVGETGVGKSCLVLRFVKGEFTANSECTIGGMFTLLKCSAQLTYFITSLTFGAHHMQALSTRT